MRRPLIRKIKGGIIYYDGQFDDARLAIDLANTAAQHGAVIDKLL